MKKVLFSSLVTGALVGVLGVIPAVSLNTYCCLLVFIGGFLSILIYNFFSDTRADDKKGLLVGFLTGAISAVVQFGVFIIFVSKGYLEINSIPGWQEAQISQYTLANIEWFLLVQMILFALIYALFGSAGGLLGAIFSKKKDRKVKKKKKTVVRVKSVRKKKK